MLVATTERLPKNRTRHHTKASRENQATQRVINRTVADLKAKRSRSAPQKDPDLRNLDLHKGLVIVIMVMIVVMIMVVLLSFRFRQRCAHKLDHRHRRIIAAATWQLYDACITTWATQITRRDPHERAYVPS